MAAPDPDLVQRLGPPVLPFERTQFSRTVESGEGIVYTDRIYDATQGGLPPNVLLTPTDGIPDQPFEGKYLWVITVQGLFLLLENTPNPDAERGVVCHTNITGGKPALQGGELWFGDDKQVYINFKSGRYGAYDNDVTVVLRYRQAVLAYFSSVGYQVVQLPPY